MRSTIVGGLRRSFADGFDDTKDRWRVQRWTGGRIPVSGLSSAKQSSQNVSCIMHLYDA
jgi:hypothetical protein